jgi:hypothetical protein
MTAIHLPTTVGFGEIYTLRNPACAPTFKGQTLNRVAYSAAHVVASPFVENDPWLTPAIDWDSTMAYRQYLWDLGLGVAEAMDTAQRGMGLGWSEAKMLIDRTLALAKHHPNGSVVCGIATDQLPEKQTYSLTEITDAYVEQCAFVEERGGQAVMMASRALAATAKSPNDYVRVYDVVLKQAQRPVVLHWLGEMFDAKLRGYWGSIDFDSCLKTVTGIISAHASKVEGIKLSLLDKDKELVLRRQLPPLVKMFTGDDCNYAELIEGDDVGFSHALLGIFDAIAPAASNALVALAQRDHVSFREILDPTVPLSRHIFKTPTQFYKTGIVFLAYLNGHQQHFQMVGGLQSARSVAHLVELFRLADQAGVFRDTDLACQRMRTFLQSVGFDQ